MRLSWKIVIAILLIIPSSCNTDSHQNEDEQSIVLTDDGSDFSGVNMGDDIQEVLAKKSSNVVYRMPDELTTRIPLDMKDSTFYEVNFNFDEDGLYVIDLDFFPKDETAVDALFEEYSQYYIYHHGDPEKKDNVYYWYTISAKGSDVEITMTNESAERKKPTLNISFLEINGK